MKKVIIISCGVLLSFFANAQDTSSASKGFFDDPFNNPLLPIYVVGFFVLVVIFLTLAVTIVTHRVLNVLTEKAAKEKAATLGIQYVVPQSAWTKFWERANKLVPLEEEKNIELDHDYDGIRELDNHLPPWWKGLFYGSMVFAVVYLVLYHLSDVLPLSGQEYENEVAHAEEQVRILRASMPAEVIDVNTLTFSNDAAMIARGKAVFMSSNCASCHRSDGGGNTIGPNLTDEYWLHGGELKDVFTTIKNGVIEKAMPAWGKVMSQKDVRDAAFYVMSLQGTNPQNAKAPQGKLYKPILDKLASDSTKVKKN